MNYLMIFLRSCYAMRYIIQYNSVLSALYDIHLADAGVEVVLRLHGRWWDVVRAPPDLHLRLPVLGRRLGLV